MDAMRRNVAESTYRLGAIATLKNAHILRSYYRSGHHQGSLNQIVILERKIPEEKCVILAGDGKVFMNVKK